MMNETCKRCIWMLRYVASLPRQTLALLVRMTGEQWEWLMQKWQLATGTETRHMWCEEKIRDAAEELQCLREYRELTETVTDLRGDVLCALLECHDYDSLYRRLMSVLDDHKRRW